MPRCNHEAIVKRAMFSFWKHGYTGCSVKVLEESTGLRSGSLYYHFKNKDGLYQICVNFYLSSILLPKLQSVMTVHELKRFFFHAHRNRPLGIKSLCFLIKAAAETAGHTLSNSAFKNELCQLETAFLQKAKCFASAASEVAGLLMDLYISLHVHTEYDAEKAVLDEKIIQRFDMINKICR